MRTIRCGFIVLSMLFCTMTPAKAEVNVSIGIGLPHVRIGVNLPFYPELELVPGYPVYYAPRIYANYFFFDGFYWVYFDGDWYASYWYNGPWWLVEPEFVPLFILRIPVRYYMRPPVHFHRWHRHEPPRWGEYWGPEWERKRSGWDRWERGSAPPPAPLPVYQKKYSGDRYPRVEEQQKLRGRHYRYQPRDATVREHIQPRVERKGRSAAEREDRDDASSRGRRQPELRRPEPVERGEPVQPGLRSKHREDDSVRRERSSQPRGPAVEEQRSRSGDDRRERGQLAPRSRDQEPRLREREPESRTREKDEWREPRREQEQRGRKDED